MNNENQPKEYDLVLGGNNPPLNALVLGGIEGIKHRFANANSDEEKIAILREAVKYSEEGEDFLADVFSTSKNKIQWIAAVLISTTNNETYKELLVDYFADVIQGNLHKWNYWKRNFAINITISLQAIKFQTSTQLINRDLSNTLLANADLSYISLAKCNLNNADLSRASLSSTNLESAVLTNTKLIEANLFGANLQKAKLLNVDLTKANLVFANFKAATLNNIIFGQNDSFEDNTLQGVNFKESLLEKIQFKNLVFDNDWIIFDRYRKRQTTFSQATLCKITFEHCQVNCISFSGANFREVIFNECNLVNTKFSNCNEYPMEVIFKNSNLQNVDFKYSDLREAIFNNVNLKGADFRKANLKGVDFTGLDVGGANFTRCTFWENNLERANTEGAKFNGNLKIWNLKGALFGDRYYYEPGYE